MDATAPQINVNSKAQKNYQAQDQVVPDDVARKTSAVDAIPRHSSLQVAVSCSCSSIILVRHGDYFRNNSDTLQSLSPEGEVQAHRAGKFLKDNILPTKFYHSNMTRSVETAKIIMSYFPPTPTMCSHLLREVAFNEIGVKPYFKVRRVYSIHRYLTVYNLHQNHNIIIRSIICMLHVHNIILMIDTHCLHSSYS